MKEQLELRWLRPDGQEAAATRLTFPSAQAAMDAFDAAMQILSRNPRKPHQLTFGSEVPEGYSARCERCGANFVTALDWLNIHCTT